MSAGSTPGRVEIVSGAHLHVFLGDPARELPHGLLHLGDGHEPDSVVVLLGHGDHVLGANCTFVLLFIFPI